jgi:nuclease HARBI1
MRFTLLDIQRLVKAFGLPHTLRTDQGHVFTAEEALIITCSRLSYPNHLRDLEDRFARDSTSISRIFNVMIDHIYDNFHHLFDTFEPNRFTPDVLEGWAYAILAANCPFDDIVLFVDAKIHDHARPGDNQRVDYNGYSKSHAYKYQALTAPHGLIVHCSGPVEGRRADSHLMEFSGLLDTLQKHCHGYGGCQLLLYGDPAYSTSDIVVSGLKMVRELSEEEQDFNRVMSKY